MPGVKRNPRHLPTLTEVVNFAAQPQDHAAMSEEQLTQIVQRVLPLLEERLKSMLNGVVQSQLQDVLARLQPEVRACVEQVVLEIGTASTEQQPPAG